MPSLSFFELCAEIANELAQLNGKGEPLLQLPFFLSFSNSLFPILADEGSIYTKASLHFFYFSILGSLWTAQIGLADNDTESPNQDRMGFGLVDLGV